MAEATLKMLLLGEDRTASKALDKVGNSAEKTHGHLGALKAGFGLVAKGFAVGVGGIATAGGALGAMGLKTAAANEQAQIAFTTMLGSAKKARGFLGELQQFAAKTPFEFPELQTAASSLISSGIEAKKVIPIMTTLGDVTSGMGTGAEGVQRATIALQQMNAAGRITGEDLNQLRDAGIPVYDLLAKATGKSKAEVVKLAQAGKLGHKELGQMMKALETGKGLERFSGLMDKQSASLSGMVATFKDTLGQNLAKAMQPLIPILKDGLVWATDKLSVFLPKVVTGLASLIQGMKQGTGPGGVLSRIIHGLVDGFRAAAAVVKVVAHWIGKELVPFIKDLAKRFMDAAGGTEGMRSTMKKLEPTARLLKAILKVLWDGIKWAAQTILPLAVKNMRLLITVIGLLSKAAIWLWNNAFQPTIKFILKGIGWLMDKIADLLGALGHVPGFGWAKDAAEKMHKAANRAKEMADNINDIPSKKKVTVTYTTIHKNRGASGNVGKGQANDAVAVGTRFSSGGIKLVGERGPELVELNRGDRVHTAQDTARMMRGGVGGGDIGEVVVVVMSEDGRVIERKLTQVRRQKGRELEFQR